GTVGNNNNLSTEEADQAAIKILQWQLGLIAGAYALDIGAGLVMDGTPLCEGFLCSGGRIGSAIVRALEGMFIGSLILASETPGFNEAVGEITAAGAEKVVEFSNLRLDTGDTNPMAAVIQLGRALWANGLGIMFALDDRRFSGVDAAVVTILTSQETGAGLFTGVSASVLGGISPRLAGILNWVGRLMLLPGFLLGYLFPYLPWLLWVGGLVGWFILVLESVIAAPLWALAHMRMDGEGIMGPAGNQGYMLALALLLRPALMLIGLLSGMVLIYVFVPFLGVSILAVSDLNRSAGSPIDLMGTLMSVGLLAFVVVTTCYKAFGMINQVPDRVLRWIGSGGSSDGREDDFRSGAFALVNTASIGTAVSAAAGVGDDGNSNNPNAGDQLNTSNRRVGLGEGLKDRAAQVNERLFPGNNNAAPEPPTSGT
ncbi:MAG: DotA/TraY family protein, partial [Pseudomonadota bacterium]